MISPASNRPPRGHMGFCWGRFVVQDGRFLEYRLFRRDAQQRTHIAIVRFSRHERRSDAAHCLWNARIQLRERVDTLTLQQLGVIA